MCIQAFIIQNEWAHRLFLIHFIIFSWFVTRKETKRSKKQIIKKWSWWNASRNVIAWFSVLSLTIVINQIFSFVFAHVLVHCGISVLSISFFLLLFSLWNLSLNARRKLDEFQTSLLRLLYSIKKMFLFRKSLSKYTHYPLPIARAICVFFVSSVQMKISKESGDDVN